MSRLLSRTYTSAPADADPNVAPLDPNAANTFRPRVGGIRGSLDHSDANFRATITPWYYSRPLAKWVKGIPVTELDPRLGFREQDTADARYYIQVVETDSPGVTVNTGNPVTLTIEQA
jgi:hypothetical protein